MLTQQDDGIDGEGTARGEPRGDEPQKKHRDDDAQEHKGIFGRGLINDR